MSDATDPLTALEAEATALRHARNAALAALATHSAPGSPSWIAQAAALPFGYVVRGPLTVAAIEPVTFARRGPVPMIFHYHHLHRDITRATALGLLRRHLAEAAAPVSAVA